MQLKEEILINLIRDDQHLTIRTYHGEYRNLMLLLFDQIYYDDFGECKGMGRCGTCIVQITSSTAPLPPRDRNENTTLTKLDLADPSLRLSCQLLIDRSLHNSTITLLS
ncbi:MAG: 2Fe-2S iron-sulfur cluster binding domain-containing protein [Bacteroidetes bacterium]|nr:2Fe-2S iron-sulfur cluster binding domain-containing protein [Bacteroidota bacterium]